MKKDYQRQIFVSNIEKFSFIIKNDIDIFSSTKTLIHDNKNFVL